MIFAVRQYNALNATAAVFCADLESHNYTAVYGHLSARQKAKFTQAQFIQISQTLDQAEGSVYSCGQATSGKFNLDLLGRRVAVASVLTRQSSGTFQTYQGTVTFQLEGDGWKIDNLDTKLLGVNPFALLTVYSYCAAVAQGSYSTAYALLGHAPQAAQKRADFMQIEHLHDQADGSQKKCTVVALGKTNTDSLATVTLTTQRSRIAPATGAVSLATEGGAWKLTSIAPMLLGRDMTPILVTGAWCADIASANYSGAYALSTRVLTEDPLSIFSATFSGRSGGSKWIGCVPDPASYAQFGLTDEISLLGNVSEVDLVTNRSANRSACFIVAPQSGTWKMSDVFYSTSTFCL